MDRPAWQCVGPGTGPASGELGDDPFPQRPGRRHRTGLDLAEETGGVFGRDGVDVETRPPFEAGDLSEPRDDLDVPMVVGEFLVVKRRGMDDVIVGRAVERLLELVEDLAEDRAEV